MQFNTVLLIKKVVLTTCTNTSVSLPASSENVSALTQNKKKVNRNTDTMSTMLFFIMLHYDLCSLHKSIYYILFYLI